MNTLVIHDTIYTITPAYVAGAKAMRENVPWHCNPHRQGSQRHHDWDAGHTHEASGFHSIYGVDIISQPNNRTEFIVPDYLLEDDQ